jgi:hypothetical protein
MNEAKKYKLQDLIEKIDQVDQMIKLHSSNPSTFMLDQYKAKKEKLLSYLIDELVDSKLRSPYSFKLIFMAISKYYPNVTKAKSLKDPVEIRYKELRDLEDVLV